MLQSQSEFFRIMKLSNDKHTLLMSNLVLLSKLKTWLETI